MLPTMKLTIISVPSDTCPWSTAETSHAARDEMIEAMTETMRPSGYARGTSRSRRWGTKRTLMGGARRIEASNLDSYRTYTIGIVTHTNKQLSIR